MTFKFRDYREGNNYDYIGFSFGGGIQSTAILLLIHHEQTWLERNIGHVPHKAYFADTELERKETEHHIQLLKEKGYFEKLPLDHVKTGLHNHIDKIPSYIEKDDGTMAMLKRRCTRDHKIMPIRKRLRKDHQKLGGRLSRNTIGLWLGISVDEIERMKESGVKYIEHIFPLIELGWDRNKCESYLHEMGWHNVKRSACYCCPYRRDWGLMKEESIEDFSKAVNIDENLRIGGKYNPKTLGKDLYLLRSKESLKEIGKREEEDDFRSECDGLCGV